MTMEENNDRGGIIDKWDQNIDDENYLACNRIMME